MFAVYLNPNGNQGAGKFLADNLFNLDLDRSPAPLIADYPFISITYRLGGKARSLAPIPHGIFEMESGALGPAIRVGIQAWLVSPIPGSPPPGGLSG